MSGTDHFSRASGSTVWLVYPKVFCTTANCQYHPTSFQLTTLTVPRIIPFQALDVNEYPQ